MSLQHKTYPSGVRPRTHYLYALVQSFAGLLTEGTRLVGGLLVYDIAQHATYHNVTRRLLTAQRNSREWIIVHTLGETGALDTVLQTNFPW